MKSRSEWIIQIHSHKLKEFTLTLAFISLFASLEHRLKHNRSHYRTGTVAAMLGCFSCPPHSLSCLVCFSWLSSRSAVWRMLTSSRQTSIWEETALHPLLGSIAHLKINQYWRQLRLAPAKHPRGFREACLCESDVYAALLLLINSLLGNAHINVNKATKLNFSLTI